MNKRITLYLCTISYLCITIGAYSYGMLAVPLQNEQANTTLVSCLTNCFRRINRQERCCTLLDIAVGTSLGFMGGLSGCCAALNWQALITGEPNPTVLPSCGDGSFIETCIYSTMFGLVLVSLKNVRSLFQSRQHIFNV